MSAFQLLCAFFAVSLAAAQEWREVSVGGVPFVTRGEASMTSCGKNKVCVLGGRRIPVTSVLDTSTLEWANGAAPPVELNHFQAVTGPDGCAWVLGAWQGKFPTETAVEDIYRYCADDNSWDKLGTIPRPRGAGGTLVYNGAIYMISGNVGGHNPDAKLVAWFDKYDLASGNWTQMPDVPNPRDHFNVALVGTKMYVAGGRNSAGTLPEFFDAVEDQVDVFDFASGSWSTLASAFGRPRGGTTAVTYKGSVYVGGGEGQGRAWREVDVLEGDAFAPGPSLLFPRHGFGMYSCNGAIWVAGGAGVQGAGNYPSATVALFEGDTPPICAGGASSPATPLPIETPQETTDAVPVPGGPGTEGPTPSAAPVTPGSPGTDLPAGPADPSSGRETPDGAGTGGPDDLNESAEASSSIEPSTRACFPGHATVELSDGTVKSMRDLVIGDNVKVSHSNEYSPVYFFSHRHAETESEFVRIRTTIPEVSLQLSPGHYLYTERGRIRAADVNVGDLMQVSHDGSESTYVVEVSRAIAKGLYNPHTLHGDVVVNKIAASTFTEAVHPSVAKMLLQPFRLIYNIFGAHAIVEGLNHNALRALDRFVW